MYSKYSTFDIIENMENEDQNNTPVTRSDIYNELIPHLNRSYISIDSLNNLVTKDELADLPKYEIVDKLNDEITNINTVLADLNSGLTREEIEIIIRKEVQKVISNSFITKDQLKPESLIPSFESFIFDSSFKNGCFIEYYNLNKDSDKFTNKFGSNSSFLKNKNSLDISFNNLVRDDNIGFKILTNVKVPKTGVYTFKIQCSGGCSFDIYELNGNPINIFREWNLEQLGDYKSTVYLDEGLLPIRILWYNSNVIDKGNLKLLWKKPDDKNFDLIPKSLLYTRKGNSAIKIPLKLFDKNQNKVKKVKVSGRNVHLHFEEIEIFNKNGKNIALDGISNTSSSLSKENDSYLLNNGIKGNHSWDISKQPFKGILLEENKEEFNSVIRNLNVPFYLYRHSFNSDVNSHDIIVYKRLTEVPDTLDMYDLIHENWNEEERNVHKTDFDLYNTLHDALRNQNAWQFCGYRQNIGFPGICGEDAENQVDYQSVNNENSKLKSFNWYYVNENYIYKNDGQKCCNHTENGPNEFVEINLAEESEISEIVIYNRPDQDMDKCSSAKLELFDKINQKLNVDSYLSGDNIMYFTL